MQPKKLLATLVTTVALISGCATTDQVLVDTTHYSTPTKGKSGIYFYQWKTGFLGAASDVRFILDGKVLGAINTGEWLYFEADPGPHKYRLQGGFLPSELPITFKEGHNYFFAGALRSGIENVVWVNDERRISEAFENIKIGRYEKGDID